ncbi:hypothetical protein [Methylobacterium sp. 391_Methyba4]|uniref:hypothetical protein n=1 Tax=Methylobacterium sp. 391_Methyba4 TaxID=3038924 RepID=UPI00241C21D0|nr:hypothetical protein [Methylobacterium sp. 391_Methyba4]WFS06476.1 hypothetical protein P9K36_24295 [Methylobacterium sp. 391_Methyba4]
MTYRIERYKDGVQVAATSVPWPEGFVVGVAKKWLARGDADFIRVVSTAYVGAPEVWSGRRGPGSA